MKLFKRLTGLLAQKATGKQYFLELGVYFLQKGSQYKIGQIITKKQIGQDRLYVTFISGLTYDFDTNRIVHKTQKRIISLKDITIEKGR